MQNKKTNETVHKYRIEKYLALKREELIWALSLQEYTIAQIARIFRLHEANILRIIRKRPNDWKPKWKKIIE